MHRLLYISDDSHKQSHEEQIEQVCSAGVRWVQLRVKERAYTDWMMIAKRVRKITSDYGALLTINDNVRIAKEIGADGVHLGRDDMSPIVARQILGPEVLIGGSANTIREIEDLTIQQVDYIGIGPFRLTSSKKNLRPTLGFSGIQSIMRHVREQHYRQWVPLIVIGGLQAEDLTEVMSAGVFGVAMGSGIRNAPEPKLWCLQSLSDWKSIME
ncbi:MAG: thiamine phosphate synthase [Bdellovibrionales bacterium]|nr:thiamine phosphate synthase [Bdellovibrionales bacterium]